MRFSAFFALFLLDCAVAAAPAKTWLLTGSAELIADAELLIAHRREQGLQIIVAPGDPAKAISTAKARPDFVLVLGDEIPASGSGSASHLPAPRGSQYRWRAVQPEDFAADPLWGDLDGDRIPDVPLGRIPARSAKDLSQVISKIIAFENRELGASDLSLPVWGGTPAYGKLLDEAATTLLLATMRKHAPSWSEPWMIYGNPRSPLSAHPPEQPAIFNERLGKGGFITCMIGHGAPDLFYSQVHQGREVSYRASDAARLTTGPPTCPLVIFACDCGNFTGSKSSLAETLLLAPGGPVVSVAASTESHPLTNYYSSLALLEEIPKRHRTFGELWHAAQIRAFKTKKPFTEALLKNAEGALEAEINIPKLKMDQLLMYTMLGDPATRMPQLLPLQIKIEPTSGGTVWTVQPPPGAKLLEVALREPRTAPRAKPESTKRDEALQLFAERNALWDFTPLQHDGQWNGRVTRVGILRIVAEAKGKLLVGTVEIPAAK